MFRAVVYLLLLLITPMPITSWENIITLLLTKALIIKALALLRGYEGGEGKFHAAHGDGDIHIFTTAIWAVGYGKVCMACSIGVAGESL